MLYRRGNVWWYEFLFRGSRIRESSGSSSKTVARSVELKRKRELETGAAGLRRRSPRLFSKGAEEWLALKVPTLSPRTVQIERTNLSHLSPVFRGMLLSDIDARDVANYQQKRLAEGAAAKTVNLEVGTLRSILRRNGFWAAIQPDVRMLSVRDDVGRALRPEEEKQLLRECAESRSRVLYPAVITALNTGLRYGELVSLRWQQIDFGSRILTVGRSKTSAGDGRVIPLNDRAFSALSLWAARDVERDAEAYVFPSEKYGYGGSAYARDLGKPIGRLKEAWEAAKRRSGVRCRWHDLRHTFCTRLLEGGTSFPRLAAIMGWSPATTARMAKRYGHVSAEALREDVRFLDRVFEFEPPIKDEIRTN